jgi:hypothetical protein
MMRNEETGMAEDALVGMLLEVAGGTVVDDRDVELARAAARWATEHAGWKLHLRNSFFFEVDALSFWILVNRIEQVLEIRTRLEPGKGWLIHARHRIGDVGHGLDVLAAEGLLPAQFSTLGRRALADYADAMDETAGNLGALADEVTEAEIAEHGDHYPWEMRIRAATMNRAADQARAFARRELAVTP